MSEYVKRNPEQSKPLLHDWKAYEQWNFTACARCGTVQNINNLIKPCKGQVYVGLREEQS